MPRVPRRLDRQPLSASGYSQRHLSRKTKREPIQRRAPQKSSALLWTTCLVEVRLTIQTRKTQRSSTSLWRTALPCPLSSPPSNTPYSPPSCPLTPSGKLSCYLTFRLLSTLLLQKLQCPTSNLAYALQGVPAFRLLTLAG
jgi:hypothetical protein